MSYNCNMYNNNQFGNEFTFPCNFRPPTVPPPPPPPMFYMPPPLHVPTQIPIKNVSDQEFINSFKDRFTEEKKVGEPKPKESICKVRDMLRNLVMELNEVKKLETELSQIINTCSDDEWKMKLNEINHKKGVINGYLSGINDSNLDELRKQVARRTAKRLRLKRLGAERKKEKEDRIKQMKEKSRKIDENLQKIKDNINKAKQEEEAKLQADMVLKEVLRKKHDARKFINKFDALKKLRKARQNTHKGRGENVSEKEMDEFVTKIDNLKALWVQKLSDYEKEEAELQKTLQNNADENQEINETEKAVTTNLAQWKEALFGDEDAMPQFNFNGDLGRFVTVRSQWDRYISEEGSSIPVGWLCPTSRHDSL
ncbi:unnamed protein product [Diatraea saccharalis]|uniref:Programmed cell death protein 7 n=1 Tax=Diatraea saccharalis TaxID=40085 RepID=A0A9N9WH95_9NEOP|nr:unnamed protein product [Diatraea saccharalis]